MTNIDLQVYQGVIYTWFYNNNNSNNGYQEN